MKILRGTKVRTEQALLQLTLRGNVVFHNIYKQHISLNYYYYIYIYIKLDFGFVDGIFRIGLRHKTRGF